MYKKTAIFMIIMFVNMLLMKVWEYTFYGINFQENKQINVIIIIFQASTLLLFLMYNMGSQSEKYISYEDLVITKISKKKFYFLRLFKHLKTNTFYFIGTYSVVIAFEGLGHEFDFLFMYFIMVAVINILNIVELYVGETTSIIIVGILIVLNMFLFDKNNTNSIFLIKAYYIFPTINKLVIIIFVNSVLAYILLKININKNRLGG